MTAPAGSIGIGVSLDASDLTSEITAAVQDAMKGALASVRSGMGQIDGALSDIDAGGFDVIGEAAKAAAKAAEEAIKRTASAADQASSSVERSTSTAARAANTALSRIDASSLTAIARGADDAGDHLARLDRWQLNALMGEINRAGTQIGQGIGAGASHAERELARLDSAGLENMLQAVQQAQRELNQAGEDAETLGQRLARAGEGGDNLAKSLAGTAAGVVGVAGVLDTAMTAIDNADLNAKLGAQLNLDPQEQAKAGKIAGSLYAENYGDSMAEVNDAISAVGSTLTNMTDDSENRIAGLTGTALDLSKAFGVDVAQSTQTANTLIRNGLAGSAEEAFDLITASMQTVPAQMRDEIFPVMDEYSTYFQSLGFGGTEAMGMIVNASQQGAIGMDKAGDALKEFGIRATDLGDKGAVEAMQSMGLNATDMANQLLKGGDTAKGAFDKIVGGLNGIKDPAKQAEAAVALFGTPLEDLDKAKIPGFLAGLQNADSALGDVTGRATEMGDQLNSGPGAALETLKREIETGLIDALGKASQFLLENKEVAYGLAGVLGALAAAYVGVKTAQAVSAIASGIHTAAMWASSAATTAASTAAWRFTAALLANPITWIVAGIAALVAGLVLFFTKTEMGKQVWETLMNAISTAWEAIKGAFAAAWEFIWPILQTAWDWIGNVLVGAFNTFLSVVQTVWNAVASVISSVWTGLIEPIFNAWKVVIFGIIVPILMAFWNQIIIPVFQGIGAFIAATWNSVIMPVWDAMKVALGWLGDAFSWVWNNVIRPVWDGLGAGISWVWENVIRPAWDGLRAGLDAIGAAFSWVVDNVIRPIWDGIGTAIRWVIDNVISPAWEGMKSGLRAVGDFFGTVVGGIKDVWNGLRNILAKPINFMIDTVYNNGIRKAWNKIGEFIPNLVEAPHMDTIPEFRKGGALRGPGTGTSDEILMWGSNGEHMVTAEEVRRAGGQNVLYAIRDMLFRGIPFEWDNGRIVSKLGQNSLQAYGAAVGRKGLGNVSPEGMFDQLLPRYATGGAIYGPNAVLEPWMLQLAKGHEFARAQHGKHYQWAGPTFVGDSFDCTGFMSSIAAAILGMNPWTRYFYTGSFTDAGGPMGFTRGTDAGFSIGVTHDPGGPGGGHAAGVLGAVPGMFSTARVESGGSIGGVHYNAGPDIMSFDRQFHLPIGANGFFQPGDGSTVGPSPEEQKSWLARKAMDVLKFITDPIADGIEGAIGAPPPEWLGIPRKFLDNGVEAVGTGIDKAIEGLGDLLSSAWAGAQSVASNVLDALNPFDSGGIASGKGFMPKNVIAPERVLSPQQTALFDQLVQALTTLAAGNFNAGVRRATGLEEDSPIVDAAMSMREATDAITTLAQRGDYTGTLGRFGIQEDHPLVQAVLGVRGALGLTNENVKEVAAAVAPLPAVIDESGAAVADSVATNTDVTKTTAAETKDLLAEAVDAWADGAIEAPVRAALEGALGSQEAQRFAESLTEGLGTEVSNAVKSAQDAMINGVVDIVKGLTENVLTGAVDALFGKSSDSYGGWFFDALAKTVGAQIEVRNTLTAVAEEMRKARGDSDQLFLATGEMLSDTAGLLERTETSMAISKQVQRDAMNEMVRATVDTLLTKILLPALTGILSALITAGLTAIGTAIGGPIGAAIGGAIGTAISGVMTSVIGGAVGQVGAVFDEGGLATGMGLMPKATIEPERVLSPAQTRSFDRLVDAIAGGAGAGSRHVEVHAPITVRGDEAGARTVHGKLLSLLDS